MGIKSTITKATIRPFMPYPKLMKHIETGRVYFAFDPGSAICLLNGEDVAVMGHLFQHDKSAMAGLFVDYDGELTLSNAIDGDPHNDDV